MYCIFGPQKGPKMGSSRTKLGPSWAKLGLSRHLEAILKRCCRHLAIANRLEAVSLPSGAVLDRSGTPGAVLTH